MTNYREILRLKNLGFSERNIALSCPCSRNTVLKVLKRAHELGISWPLTNKQTNAVLEKMLYPKNANSNKNKRMPALAYIHKKLLKNGVSKKLLWTEYMEDCRLNGEEPLMYSQFCYYIQQDEQKRRATMHIRRKPGEQVEVDWAGRITDKTIEVFYNHNRIASHRRLYRRKGQYSTITEHMPEEHQKYLEWNGDRFRKWAEKIGTNTYQAVDAILTSKRVEQQTYKSCMGLLKMADKYSTRRLEAACKKALSYTATPSYKSIKNILTTGKDKPQNEPDKQETTHNNFGIIRGAGYYGRWIIMTNRCTIDKLIEMRLTAMSDAFCSQLTDAKMKEVPFEDRFGMLVDIEYSNRKKNRLKRLIRNAEFDQPDASIMDIDYTCGRKLNKQLIKRLQPANTSQNTEIYLLPVQQGAVKHTWHAPLEWRPANGTIQQSM